MAHSIGPAYLEAALALRAKPLVEVEPSVKRPSFDGLPEEVIAMRVGDVLRWQTQPEDMQNVRARAHIAAARAGLQIVTTGKIKPGVLYITRVE